MFFPKRSDKVGLLSMGGISLILHVSLAAFLNLNPWPTVINVRPTAYSVTLMPVSMPEPEIPKTDSPSIPKEETIKPVEKVKPIEKIKPVEKEKPILKPHKEAIVEKVKKPEKKLEKTTEEKKESLKHLQEALEEIRKKVVLDEIRKKLAYRERIEERPSQGSPPIASPGMESKLNEYYNLIWTKIKGAWTLPENLLKETIDLETIIVVIIEQDGKINKWWFEKKSGNPLYDQSAMRALKKAEPLPPIPKELSEDKLEVGIRFFPE